MVAPLALLDQGFRDRVRSPRAWSWLAYAAPRLGVALALAVLPCLALLVVAAVAPPAFARAMTNPHNVQETFARFVSAIATASAVAVSVASLTMGRELKGIQKQEERHRTNAAYRERVARAAGRPSTPLVLGSFLSVAFGELRSVAERARAEATRASVLDVREAGVPLGAYLEALAKAAARAEAGTREGRAAPHRLASAAMDFEHEVSVELARRFRVNSSLPAHVRESLASVFERAEDVVLGAKYAKTLDMQWGLSRMSTAVLATTIPGVLVASLMVLTYGEGAREALGILGSSALVAAALAAVILPLACFVSYLTRFVFLNEHTLPTDSFVLGPEEAALVDGDVDGSEGPASGSHALG